MVMTHRLYIIALLCLAGSLLSCRKNTPYRIEYEKSFAEIAQLAADEDKHFAIVLADPDSFACRALYIALYYISADEEVIFNVVDITLPQNRWYQQLIQSGARPTTLVFSPDAQLKAIIQGASRSGIDCIANVLNNNIDCAPFFNSLTFPPSIPHEDVIRTLNLILTAKQKIESGEDAVEKLEKALNTLYYPFPLWLKMKNEYNLGYTEDAVLLARQLLTFQDPLYTRLYSDLFLAARKVINPDFDVATMPILEIEIDDVDLGDLLEGSDKRIRIKLRNTGKELLVLHDVNVGCSCLTLLDVNSEIKPNDGTYLYLLFTAEQSGEVRRNVTITANTLTPLHTIAVRADVW